MFRKLGLTIAIMVLALGILNTTALAATYNVDGVVVNYPDSYVSCRPSDTITITLPEGATAYYYFMQHKPAYAVLGEGYAPVGGLSASFPYPSLTPGTLYEFSVDVSYTTAEAIKNKVYLKWNITCEAPPTLTPTPPPTPTPTPPPGFEGCTPGYWRNHLQSWPATGYSTSADFDTTFGVNYFTPDITLGQAIQLGGGGYNPIARHGTAALLSASHLGVDYPYTVAQVIAFVQANDKATLEAANELGCPLN